MGVCVWIFACMSCLHTQLELIIRTYVEGAADLFSKYVSRLERDCVCPLQSDWNVPLRWGLARDVAVLHTYTHTHMVLLIYYHKWSIIVCIVMIIMQIMVYILPSYTNNNAQCCTHTHTHVWHHFYHKWSIVVCIVMIILQIMVYILPSYINNNTHIARTIQIMVRTYQ